MPGGEDAAGCGDDAKTRKGGTESTGWKGCRAVAFARVLGAGGGCGVGRFQEEGNWAGEAHHRGRVMQTKGSAVVL